MTSLADVVNAALGWVPLPGFRQGDARWFPKKGTGWWYAALAFYIFVLVALVTAIVLTIIY
ncbi:MAG: hypothetical protein KDA20_11535 [Phycisphaerales bacterium]|nr:hypothetical protein [Phycisphaerales bacterium]